MQIKAKTLNVTKIERSNPVHRVIRKCLQAAKNGTYESHPKPTLFPPAKILISLVLEKSNC